MSQHNITALIYNRRGQLLSIGKNSYLKTHPLQASCAKAVGEEHKIFLHAEIAALTKLRDWAKAYRVVVTRFAKDGRPLAAKPCKVCLHALRLANIQHIEHT